MSSWTALGPQELQYPAVEIVEGRQQPDETNAKRYAWKQAVILAIGAKLEGVLVRYLDGRVTLVPVTAMDYEDVLASLLGNPTRAGKRRKPRRGEEDPAKVELAKAAMPDWGKR